MRPDQSLCRVLMALGRFQGLCNLATFLLATARKLRVYVVLRGSHGNLHRG